MKLKYNFTVIIIIILAVCSCLLGYFLVKQFYKPTLSSTNQNVSLKSQKNNNNETPPIEATEISEISERAEISTDNYTFNDSTIILRSIHPTYGFKLFKINEVEKNLFETVWQFTVSGEPKLFKVLSTECSLIRDKDKKPVLFGQIKLKNGENGWPFYAILQSTFKTDTNFSDNNSLCRKVWTSLQVDPKLNDQLFEFFTKGTVPQNWNKDAQGVINLINKLILVSADNEN